MRLERIRVTHKLYILKGKKPIRERKKNSGPEMEPRSEEDQERSPNSLLCDESNPPNGDKKMDHGQDRVISPQTLDQPKPRNDDLLQPSIPTASPPSAESLRIMTLTPATPLPVANFRYRECLKNHAVSIGGHVVDGCGEFMPSGEEGTLELFRCAACGCHRNFHRKEIVGHGGSEPWRATNIRYNHLNGNGFNYGQIKHAANSMPPQTLLNQSGRYRHRGFSPGHASPVMVAFGGGGEVESSSEDLGAFQHGSNGGGWRQEEEMVEAQPHQSPKKRVRTKFSEGQKEKMMKFAEKLGWKMQKGIEDEVVKFCEEVGVRRQVFKVWMHNNKQAMKRKQPC